MPLLLAPALASAAPPVLESVDVLDARHATALHLRVEGAAAAPVETRVLSDPPRLVVTLPGVTDASPRSALEIGGRHARRIQVVSEPNGVSLVIEPGHAAEPFHQHGVSATDDGFLVVVGVDPAPGAAPVSSGPPAGAGGGAVVLTSASGAPVQVAQQTGGQAPAGKAAPAPAASAAPASGAQPIRADGLQFRVSRFDLRYAQRHADAPPLDDLLQLEVELGRTDQGYVAPREGVPPVRLRLGEVPSDPLQLFYGSAIRAINERIVTAYTDQGLAGVLVIPDEEDVDTSSGRDLRPPGQTELHLVIWLGRLLEFRTFASGQRVSEEERIDAPVHRKIKEQSPLQPGDLLRKHELDEYLAWLNRHPGRNVDVTLSAATEPGGVYLDYLVAENRPYQAYFQASNTGTKQTTDWRQRFGFQHNQLTNRDDILKIDYITGSFDKVNGVFASYEAPIWKWRRLRGRIGGNWAEYDASDFGVTGLGQDFTGDLWGVGGQLLYNVFQYEEFFVDGFAGLRYQDVSAVNEPFPGSKQKGDAQFFFPEFGLMFERNTEESRFRVATSIEFNVPGVAGTEKADLANFGRLRVDEKDFKIFRWDAFTSFYLEPLLFRQGYLDPSTPRTSTLAHEIFLGTRGQTSFDDRLIPQLQRIVGGLFTVRGYKEATAAGDTGILGRFEYRFHLPRVLPIRPQPAQVPVIGDFRVAPTQVYGQPDWDLILRAFFDAGRTLEADKVVGEGDETLLGTGLGVELRVLKLRFLSNLTLSFDWGHALHDAKLGTSNQVKAGDNRFHFLATIAR